MVGIDGGYCPLYIVSVRRIACGRSSRRKLVMNLTDAITMGQLVSVLLVIAILLAFIVHYLGKKHRHDRQ